MALVNPADTPISEALRLITAAQELLGVARLRYHGKCPTGMIVKIRTCEEMTTILKRELTLTLAAGVLDAQIPKG